MTDDILAQLRADLLEMATRRLGPNAVAVDASGVVQDAFLDAEREKVKGMDVLRTLKPDELLAWLRVALERNLIDAVRRAHAAKRDVARQRPLDAPAGSHCPPIECPVAPGSSPCERAERNEQLGRMDTALGSLPDDQRRAVELHYLARRTVAEVAAELGRSPEAVGGLLRRGLRRLRDTLASEG